MRTLITRVFPNDLCRYAAARFRNPSTYLWKIAIYPPVQFFTFYTAWNTNTPYPDPINFSAKNRPRTRGKTSAARAKRARRIPATWCESPKVRLSRTRSRPPTLPMKNKKYPQATLYVLRWTVSGAVEIPWERSSGRTAKRTWNVPVCRWWSYLAGNATDGDVRVSTGKQTETRIERYGKNTSGFSITHKSRLDAAGTAQGRGVPG